MLNTIFAKKIGMAQKFSPEGERWGVTKLKIANMEVAGVRSGEKHGYAAVQVKIWDKKGRDYFKEVRYKKDADLSSLTTGTAVEWDKVLGVGDNIKVSGISKGHGFTGVVKRYKFSGGPRTHGQSDRERARGSSGPTTTPGRVLPGKRMAGRMGNEQVTIKGLKVMDVDLEKRILTVGGSIPGSAADWVRIEKV
mgnify:FL=1